MPRSYLGGWYHALKVRRAWRKKFSGTVKKNRMRMWRRMVKRRYFWKTPEERVEGMQKFIDGLKELGKTLSIPDGYEETVRDTRDDK